MSVTYNKQAVLQGTRDIITGLCRVTLQSLYITTQQNNNIHQVNGKETAINDIHAAYFSQYKTHGQEHLIGVTSVHGMDSRQKTSTGCLRLRTQSRSISHRSVSMHIQQPTGTLDTSIQKYIQSKNNITARQSSLWPQWTKLTRSRLTMQENPP